MTEAEWLWCDNPQPMLDWVQDQVPVRKPRLYACGLCRTAWHLIPVGPLRTVIETAEAHADGECDDQGFGAAVADAHRAVRKRNGLDKDVYDAARYRRPLRYVGAYGLADTVARSLTASSMPHPGPTAETTWVGDRYVTRDLPVTPARLAWNDRVATHLREAAGLLRDVVGNPFQPPAFNPGWRTPTALAVATSAYADRAFDRLPILADALEDAGCDDPDLLAHLRGPGPHVRGCWALDLVLGKD